MNIFAFLLSEYLEGGVSELLVHFVSGEFAIFFPKVTFPFSCVLAGAECCVGSGSSPTFGVVSLFNHGHYLWVCKDASLSLPVAWGSKMAFPGSLSSLSSVASSIFLGSVSELLVKYYGAIKCFETFFHPVSPTEHQNM